MINFRDLKYLQRYEYVSVQLDTPLNMPANTQHQKPEGYTFSIDNTSESYPFDWYNAFIKVDFQVQKVADGTAYADANNISTVNSIYSFFLKVSIDFNGVLINTSSDINHCCYIKNLLDFSKSYENEASNSFNYPDINSEQKVVIRQDSAANLTADILTGATKVGGYFERHTKIITNQTVQALLSLNRYGFFESLEFQICPQGKVKITIDLESSNNLIFRTGAAAAGRVVVMKMLLYVPKLVFNGDGRQLFLNNYLYPHQWNFYEENCHQFNANTAIQGTWSILSSVSKPRHVFVWAINSDKLNSQEHSKFFHDIFNIRDQKFLSSCQLEVGSGNYYPTETLHPHDDLALAYRMLMSYNTSYNDHQTGSQFNLNVFKNLYGMIYFNIRNQPTDLRLGSTKLIFKWRLDGVPNNNYYLCAVVINEESIKVVNESGKAFLKK